MKVLFTPLLYLKYEFRKEFIIEKYCVNKDKPALHCDGKCYLAQKIKESQEKESEKESLRLLNSLLTVESIQKETFFEFTLWPVFRKQVQFPAFHSTYHFEVYGEYFHPPAFG
ncbi:hypothetical protein [Jiulongibacter sediminis]|uniref:hypothetical protein n=1 Tax=Jiulongibacter sediminis TaxID=1605367 RepID=UPI0006DC6185|nr:hypothetical protein [Jiulongibacter sediminis]TBX21694.1 hypothetical protein TK44_18745 [Jiulongibacter sediminis]